MLVRITVGEVELRIEGVDWTRRQVTSLLTQVASIAVALTGEPEPDPPQHPMGFTAQIERAPEVYEDFSEWFEE
jgi:hypothetical protein